MTPKSLANADTLAVPDEVPTLANPLRQDAPGSVTEMPAPDFIGHVHIFTDENYEKIIDFYVNFFAGEVVAVQGEYPMTFVAYDEYDHRFAIIKREGGAPRSDNFLGYSHLSFGYRSLGEIIFIYERMKVVGCTPHLSINHGNSTSFYYRDPDGNEIETMVDNYAPIDTKAYKMHYQYSEEFGKMAEGAFEAEKMLDLYRAGVSDQVLLDRDHVKRLKAEGKL